MLAKRHRAQIAQAQGQLNVVLRAGPTFCTFWSFRARIRAYRSALVSFRRAPRTFRARVLQNLELAPIFLAKRARETTAGPAKNPREQSFVSFCERSLALKAFCGSSVSICKALWAVLPGGVVWSIPSANGAERSGAKRSGVEPHLPMECGTQRSRSKTAQRAWKIDTELEQNAGSVKRSAAKRREALALVFFAARSCRQYRP